MPELFPIIQPQTLAVQTELPLCKDIAWDFDKSRPIIVNGIPVVATGKEAVKVWAYKALLTARGRHEIYTRNHGSELETLIGQNYTVHTKRAEAVRYTRECLLVNPYITSIDNIAVDFGDGTLHIAAAIKTIYGEVELYV